MMKSIFLSGCGTLLVLAVASGCGTVRGTSAPVASGEPVSMEYSCRLGDGSLAASNRADAATAVLNKSVIFVPTRDTAPVAVIAGKGLKEEKPISIRSFEDEIAVQLARKIVGLETGVESALEIRGDGSLAADGQSHKLPMATVRVRQKEIHIDKATYLARTGKEPQPGQAFSVDPLIPGKVVEVKGDDVLIRATAAAGDEVTTPFGKGVIRETPENYEIVLSPIVGSLVRSGPIVGRISQVNERQFVTDYSDPFGGEPLKCDVRLERQTPDHKDDLTTAGK
jgi:FKBP-type peptidyl-prolyl cis-trans isomerase 2